MKEIVLEQNSTDWHLWRSTGIGASEASVIMGLNPWESIEELYNKKLNPGEEQLKTNEFISFGLKNEDAARERLMYLIGEDLKPLCAEHIDYPFIKASLDGINPDGDLIAEIKCPAEKNFWRYFKQISPYYYTQVQQQFLVSKASVCCFFAFRDKNNVILREVFPNSEFMEELKNRIILFWSYVENKEPLNIEHFKKFEFDNEILKKGLRSL